MHVYGSVVEVLYLFVPVGPINDDEKNTRLYDCSYHHSIPNPLKEFHVFGNTLLDLYQ
jgi:hypothetical protein